MKGRQGKGRGVKKRCRNHKGRREGGSKEGVDGNRERRKYGSKVSSLGREE